VAGVGVDDDVGAPRQVVDHRQFLGLQQQDVGQAEIVGLGLRQLLLEKPHGVVAEVAGQPAAEARHARPQRDLELGKVLLDEGERVAALLGDHRAVGHHLDPVPARLADEGADRRARRQADERVAAEALAAYHRLEQEGVRARALCARQLQVKRQRRLEVGKALRDQRDAVIALRGEGPVFEFGHASPGGRPRRSATNLDCGIQRSTLRAAAGRG